MHLLLTADASPHPGALIGLVLICATPLLGSLLLLKLCYRRIRPEQALIIGRPGGTTVSFTGRLILPLIHSAEVIDLKQIPLTFEIDADDPARFLDDSRATLRVRLDVRVNRVEPDILRAAQIYSLDTLASPERLHAHLAHLITGTTRTLIARFDDLRDLRGRADMFADLLLEHLGMDHDGLVIESASISKLESL